MSKGRLIREFDPRTATRNDIMAASGEHDTHYDEGAAEPGQGQKNRNRPQERQGNPQQKQRSRPEAAEEAAKGAPQ